MWKAPEFKLVKMDAEIGSYQQDDAPQEPPFCQDEHASERLAAESTR